MSTSKAPSLGSPLHAPSSLPVTLFNSASTRGGWVNREETAAFLTACELFLKKNRPDLVWTYGGDSVALAVQHLAKQHGIPVLFALHNLSYRELTPFRMADRVMVPCEFARRHYREKLGLECDVLPLVVDPTRVSVCSPGFSRNLGGIPPEGGTTNFVTFVNPTPLKGVFIFARIAEMLSRRRPDIPLLIVEGSSKVRPLPKLGIDLSGIKNLRIMPNTPDARQFFAATKLLLMPSLMENAALVAIEAMFNGIPVLASTRGGLPETIGGCPHPGPLPDSTRPHPSPLPKGEGSGGFLFDIPARYTPETREAPTAEEVAPWVETIIRLWDDAEYYEKCSRAARSVRKPGIPTASRRSTATSSVA